MFKEDDMQVPELIHDNSNNIYYKKGRFFGKGGFALCYEIINNRNNEIYAGKIISKKLITKQNQKEKMTQEIQIHSTLRHPNVVNFCSFFEDLSNVYIVLELCKRKSMMELHKRRKVLTEPETRYYMHQILNGVQYLHHQKIIHRDLKLGNLFLNDELHVKIGDFGLAAKIEYDGERKKTLCGTPNYIAPEILNKNGHSYEVDVWSIGCIMYTLLVGKPPFETKTLKETYAKIRKCDYRLTSILSQNAKHMIMLMLQSDPNKRPKVSQLLYHEFIIKGYCPPSLPVSCLTMAPRFDQADAKYSPRRGPLLEIPSNNIKVTTPKKQNSIAAAAAFKDQIKEFNAKENLLNLKDQLYNVIKSNPRILKSVPEEMTDPAAHPTIWISKWVDYSDKYGFGYQLSDESVGVMFNDTTRLVMLSNGINVHYVDRDGEETYMTVDNYPEMFEKKMKLLSYFNRYMREHLTKTGAGINKESDSLSRTPYLHQWCRSTSGVLMQLNSGILQVNFGDHTKIIMCPLMSAITYIAEDKSFKTFRFSTIETYGCVSGLLEKIKYAFNKILILLDNQQPQ